jgi:hypothetical protein
MSKFSNKDMNESIGRLDSGGRKAPATCAVIPQP